MQCGDLSLLQNWRAKVGESDCLAVPARGAVGTYGLVAWWNEGLTPVDRVRICERYQGGANELIEIEEFVPGRSPIGYLLDLATWFKSRSDRVLLRKILAQAERILDADTAANDAHFLYSAVAEEYFDRGRASEEDKEAAARACLMQIANSAAAASYFREKKWDQLPNHRGYQILAEMLEDDGQYVEVVHLAEQADREGWGRAMHETWSELRIRCTKHL